MNNVITNTSDIGPAIETSGEPSLVKTRFAFISAIISKLSWIFSCIGWFFRGNRKTMWLCSKELFPNSTPAERVKLAEKKLHLDEAVEASRSFYAENNRPVPSNIDLSPEKSQKILSLITNNTVPSLAESVEILAMYNTLVCRSDFDVSAIADQLCEAVDKILAGNWPDPSSEGHSEFIKANNMRGPAPPIEPNFT